MTLPITNYQILAFILYFDSFRCKSAVGISGKGKSKGKAIPLQPWTGP
jgi:hypothetical protein